MAENLAEEIETVLKKIGPDKFAAVVTDNAANCSAARNIISEKYTFIFNTRCIVHCVNLITKDVLGKALLEKYIKEFNIEGGGLKTWVETCWITMFDSINSIWHLRSALEKVVNEHGSIVNNKTVIKIITA
ncbi:hypothetical protein RhiirA5_386026 [Rhizophagus irregularis]|uniref:DUF659 domain-containing protein n=1 Tax=Rhizophagus irregularis TaxID=588596 RepID=A0A2N0NLJ0_9GLOM|nr:hypothetical protein RhiirA5_386026 [Rhizophagus irregularis]